MNEENFNDRRNRRRGRFNSGRSNVWTGLILVVIGGLLLARTAGVLFPEWFFTWPMIVIAAGIFNGVRHKFRGGAWIMLLLVGGIFLADKVVDDINLRPYFWPIILIAAGLGIIFRPKSSRCRTRGNEMNDLGTDSYTPAPYNVTDADNTSFGTHADVIDITAIFSGIKKSILSKNFKGGDVVAVMGGAEINLTQADFTGKIMIDNFNMFGGTKLIVPPDWDVQSQVVAIFGGVDDKRPPATNHDPSKVIVLDGTCIFGGIEIRSF